jgi:DNA polymerase I
LTTHKLPKHIEQPDPSIYKSNNYLVLDFETEGFPLDPNARILLSGWKWANQPYVHHWGDQYALASLHSALDMADFVVCHNAKFELQWLLRSGYDIAKVVVFDTMLAEHVLLGNRRGPHDLDSLGEKYCGERKSSLVAKLIHGGASVSSIPRGWLRDYNRQDVELTESVFLEHRRIIYEQGLGAVLFTRCLTTIPLADIELRGMFLDRDRVQDKWEEVNGLYNEISTKLDSLAGGINFNSPKQVGELLYDKLGFRELLDFRGNVSKTESGNRRTDEDAITQLKPETDDQRKFQLLFLSYRKLALARRNLSKLQECIKNDAGTLYAQLNQHITQTHRLSSTGGKYKLQFQNFDRTWKPLFRARRENWKIGEVDGKQLEFRVAVHLGNGKR